MSSRFFYNFILDRRRRHPSKLRVRLSVFSSSQQCPRLRPSSQTKRRIFVKLILEVIQHYLEMTIHFGTINLNQYRQCFQISLPMNIEQLHLSIVLLSTQCMFAPYLEIDVQDVLNTTVEDIPCKVRAGRFWTLPLRSTFGVLQTELVVHDEGCGTGPILVRETIFPNLWCFCKCKRGGGGGG